MNNQIRQVESARARGKQSLIHVFIFTRKKPLPCATERSLIQPNLLKDRARNDGIASHQYPRIIRIKWNHTISTVNPSNNAHIIHWQPIWRTSAPFRHIRATDEINTRLTERGLNASKPSLINLFVIIYHAYQIAIG